MLLCGIRTKLHFNSPFSICMLPPEDWKVTKRQSYSADHHFFSPATSLFPLLEWSFQMYDVYIFPLLGNHVACNNLTKFLSNKKSLCSSTRQISLVLCLFGSLKMFICNFKRWLILSFLTKKEAETKKACALKLQNTCLKWRFWKSWKKYKPISWDAAVLSTQPSRVLPPFIFESAFVGNALDSMNTSCPHWSGTDLISSNPKGLKFV